MQREVIKPQADVPVVVKLDKGPEGQEREGRYGIDYQYTVNGDRGVMWLPKEARDHLVRCGAQAGDEVQIVKSLRGRIAQWSVQVMPDSNELAPPPPPRRLPAPPPPPQQNGHANGYTNGHGNGSAGHPTPTPVQPSTAQRPAAQWMAGALCASIDASIAATNYAKDRGIELKFNEEDIRSMAATMYINASKEGRL